MWALDGLGMAGEVGDGVMGAGETDRFPGQERLDDRQGLGEASDPRAGRIEGDAGLLVVGEQRTAGAEAELEAAVREQVEGGRLLGDEGGVTQVVLQHEGADPEGGGGGDGGEGGAEGELLVEVIGDQGDVVAERLNPSRLLAPFLARRGVRELDAEAERARRDRGVMSAPLVVGWVASARRAPRMRDHSSSTSYCEGLGWGLVGLCRSRPILAADLSHPHRPDPGISHPHPEGTRPVRGRGEPDGIPAVVVDNRP